MRDDPPRPAQIARNARQKMSGYVLLRGLEAECAKLVVFDPQYRAVLDHLDFGNEGERQKERARLPQMSDAGIAQYVEEIERVLKPNGHLAFWIDKFGIGSGHHLRYFNHTWQLKVVDLLCWNNLRFGMGRRLRGSCEYLLIAQKLPAKAKGSWTDATMRDCWAEQSDRERHPHAKPYQLTERVIRATTKKGDLVVDPCAGSYVVLEACQATGREFAGCDLIEWGET